MYTGLLHSHRLVVILFLLLYGVKLVLLLLGNEARLERFGRLLRIPEMILSGLFLLTGVGMLFMIAQITPMLVVKVLLVLASIPLAVIGFRRRQKLLAALSVLLIVASYGLAEANKIGVDATPLPAAVADAQAPGYDPLVHGQAIYGRNCIVCHGPQGNGKGSGAKDLTISQLSDEQVQALLMKGKNAMPSYAKVLSPAEMQAVAAYVKTLRVNP
jgi:mono/diheme cytochrome c family protein